MQGDSDDDHSIMSYSDQQDQIEENEEMVEDEIGENTEPDGLNKTEFTSLELIYIMFSFYRKEFEELAEKYKCKVRFSTSSYTVEQIGECSK